MTTEHSLAFFKMLELENYFAATIEDPETKERYAMTFCKINSDSNTIINAHLFTIQQNAFISSMIIYLLLTLSTQQFPYLLLPTLNQL